ncbi:hypothetical protein [Pseudomonas fluorescens]|uniref:Uncharacterized protein n=1 Tax=Pseudomonas fluorescens TaxID=294 RepID=A0A5E7EC33_PSEFL|nr:hypothetical protein [Pseudomonas fluorescens]VVO23937.1 hypothetical protein PS710_04467 [Pseudomonas fluorescens]
MSSREILIEKIKKYTDAKNKANQKRDAEKSRFESMAPQLYSKIEEILNGIPEITTSTLEPLLPAYSINMASFSITLIDKSIDFDPAEESGFLGLKVSNLFDRPLFFRPLSSGNWEAEDERSDKIIHLSDRVLFERLAALVP